MGLEPLYIGASFAFTAAIFFSLSSVATRRGVLHGYVYSTVLISILIGIPMYLFAALLFHEIDNVPMLTLETILPFILAGIIHFVIGRYILYSSVHYIGASSTMPIVATSNVFSAFIAIPILRETVTPFKVLGLVTAAIGIGLIASMSLNIKGFKKGVVLAFSSALVFSSSALIVRYGLIVFNSPILGVLISYLSALPVYISLLSTKVMRREMNDIPRKTLTYILVSGVLVNFGQLFRYLALNLIEVSVASPLISTIPILTIIFSYLINRDIEIINIRNFLASIIIFIGIILVIMGST